MTATVSNIVETVFGNKRIVKFDVALGAYTGGGTGVSVDPSKFGMGRVDLVLIEPGTDGIEYQYDYTNKSIKAYRCGGVVAAGTVSSDLAVLTTATGVTVQGGQPTGSYLYLTANTNAGKLGVTGVTGATIPLNTFGIPKPSAALSTGPTFNGATVQSSLVEVDSATLSTACHCIAIGE